MSEQSEQHNRPPDESLIMDELNRIAAICEKTDDPEIVGDFLASAYYARSPQDRNEGLARWNLDEYDRVWAELGKQNVQPPKKDDPRTGLSPKALDEVVGYSQLSPTAIFQPREELEKTYHNNIEQEAKKLVEETTRLYKQLSEQIGQADADFLLSLAGGRFENGEIEFGDTDPQKLEDVRRTAILMTRKGRDIIRTHIELYKEKDPELAAAVQGTPIDDPDLRRIRTIIEEWLPD